MSFLDLGFVSLLNTPSSHRLTSNTRTANNDIVIPECVGISTIRLPPKVNTRDLGLKATPRPLSGIGVCSSRLDGQSINSGVVQPCFHGAISSQVVLETLPRAGGKRFGGRDALRGEVGECGIVGFAVVHDDLGLTTNAEMLAGGLCGVGHCDEGYVGVGQGLGRFAVRT